MKTKSIEREERRETNPGALWLISLEAIKSLKRKVLTILRKERGFRGGGRKRADRPKEVFIKNTKDREIKLSCGCGHVEYIVPKIIGISASKLKLSRWMQVQRYTCMSGFLTRYTSM